MNGVGGIGPTNEHCSADCIETRAERHVAVLPGPASTLAPSTVVMREVFALLQRLATDERHGAEKRECAAEQSELAHEDAGVAALRQKATDAFCEGLVGGLSDAASAGILISNPSATPGSTKAWVTAGSKFCEGSGKLSAGYFKSQGIHCDAEKASADGGARHAGTLAKDAASMAQGGHDLSRSVLEHMKQFFDQELQTRMSIHFA